MMYTEKVKEENRTLQSQHLLKHTHKHHHIMSYF